jgi:hypothetical protein
MRRDRAPCYFWLFGVRWSLALTIGGRVMKRRQTEEWNMDGFI